MDKKKILIIDDETDFIMLIKKRLEANGYEISTASDGVKGLEKAGEVNPDLILLDIKMAQMDGYTTLLELKKKEQTKSTPVVILTAYDKMQDMFKMEGVKDYITKPFDDQDLLLRIARALK